MKFMSQEWIDTHEKQLRTELSKEGKFTFKLVEIYEDCPDGTTKWVYYSLKNSLLEDMQNGEGNDTPEAEFKCYGKYESYIKVLKGELNSKAALIDGTFKLAGNMMKALSMLGIYSKVEKSKHVEGTEY